MVGVMGEAKAIFMEFLAGERAHDGTLQIVRSGLDSIYLKNYLDPIHPSLKIEESILYYASFLESRRDADLDFVDMFGLGEKRGKKVGPPDPWSLEWRLVMIASHLALHPSLVILSDPTEGLKQDDSMKILTALRSYSNATGIPIVIGINEPKEIFTGYLNSLMILAYNGKEVFHGPLANAKAHFKVQSMAEIYELIKIDYSGPTRFYESLEQTRNLISAWTEYDERLEAAEMAPDLEIRKSISTWRQFAKLIWRFFIAIFRDWAAFLALLIQIFVPFTLLSFVFFNKPLNLSGIQLRVSLFFSLAVNNTFSVMIPAALSYSGNQVYLRREAVWLELYRVWIAPLAYLSVLVPLRMILVLGLMIPLYYLTGLRRGAAENIIAFLGMMTLNTLVSSIAGVLIGTLSPSLDVTQLLVVLTIDIYILFGGLGAGPGQRPTWILRWLQYLSPIYYTFRGLLRNEIVGSGWDGPLLGRIETEIIPFTWTIGGLLLLATGYMVALLVLHLTLIKR